MLENACLDRRGPRVEAIGMQLANFSRQILRFTGVAEWQLSAIIKRAEDG